MSAKIKQLPNPEVAAGVADVTFRLLVACQEKERRAAEKFHLSVPEFRVLRVFRTSSSLRVKDLLQLLDEDNSRLSRVLANLEESGFLVRSIQPDDRRGVMVTLTRKGTDLVGNLEQRYVEMHEEILKDIPSDLHQPLLGGLEKLLVAVERWLKDA
jgi:DNA-binding MarR family transcriptional regulator